MFSTRFEQQDVAIGVSDGEGSGPFFCGDAFLVKGSGGLGKVLRLQGEAGLGAERRSDNLNLLAGLSGEVHHGLVTSDGFEVELIDVEVAGTSGVFHGECDDD